MAEITALRLRLLCRAAASVPGKSDLRHYWAKCVAGRHAAFTLALTPCPSEKGLIRTSENILIASEAHRGTFKGRARRIRGEQFPKHGALCGRRDYRFRSSSRWHVRIFVADILRHQGLSAVPPRLGGAAKVP